MRLPGWMWLGLLAVQLGCAHTQGGSASAPDEGVVAAQRALPEGASPSVAADWVLDRSHEVQGLPLLGGVTTRVQRGTMEMIGQGIFIQTYQVWQAPDRLYLKQEIPGVGVMEQGTDGVAVWARDPFMGLRELEGAERATFLQGTLASELAWKQVWPTRELLEVAREEARVIYRVRLTPTEGEPMIQDIDAATFLPVRLEMYTKGAMGRMKMIVFLEDYRDVGGQLISFEQTVMAGRIQTRLRLKESVDNVEIDPSVFVKPLE